MSEASNKINDPVTLIPSAMIPYKFWLRYFNALANQKFYGVKGKIPDGSFKYFVEDAVINGIGVTTMYRMFSDKKDTETYIDLLSRQTDFPKSSFQTIEIDLHTLYDIVSCMKMLGEDSSGVSKVTINAIYNDMLCKIDDFWSNEYQLTQ